MSPKLIDKEAKRAEITRAATEVFARKGFQGAAVDDVAAAAGVSKGSVYAYFRNKEDLFFATFQAYQGEMVAEWESAIARAATARGRLTACLMGAMASLRAHIELFPLTLELWAAASSGPTRERLGAVMRDVYREFRGLTADIIDAGKAAGEFRDDVDSQAVAAALVGGVDGLMLQYWFDREVDVQGSTESLLNTVMRGIAADADRGGMA